MLNDELTENPKPKRRGRSVAGLTAKAADNLRTDVDSRIKFKRDNERQKGSDLELNLSVPPGTIPSGYTGLWVLDSGKGEVEQKLAQWWGHVTDAQGVNISRQSGARKVYLMAIEDEYKKELDDLQMERYRASIGENDRKSLDVEGVEATKSERKVKVTTDPFEL